MKIALHKILRPVGLALAFALPLLSYAPGANAKPEPKKSVPGIPPAVRKLKGKKLRQAEPWRRCLTVWREAASVSSPRSGPRPLTDYRKTFLLKNLQETADIVRLLKLAELLRDDQARLLSIGNETWTQAVRLTPTRSAPPGQRRKAIPAAAAAKRLERRLPQLKKFNDNKTITLEVAAPMLEPIDRDLAVIRDSTDTKAIRLTDQVGRLVQSIRERSIQKLEPVERSAPWMAVRRAFEEAAPVIENPSVPRARRQEIADSFDDARKAAMQLAALNLLSPSGADLLAAETERLWSRINRVPPSDFEGDFLLMDVPEPLAAFERLRRRLPLLRSLPEEGLFRDTVLDRTLPVLEDDIETLSDPKAIESLDKRDRDEATRLVNEARQIADRLTNGAQ